MEGLIPIAVLCAFGYAIYTTTQTTDARVTATWEVNAMTDSPHNVLHTPPTSDHETGNDRVGMHHIAKKFGSGYRCHFPPAVMSHLSSL